MSKPLEEQGLPLPIQKAVITYDGKLTDRFNYIGLLRKQEEYKKKGLQDVNNFRRKSGD